MSRCKLLSRSAENFDKNNQNKSAQKKFLFVSFHFFTPEWNLILIAQRQIKPNSTNIVRLYSESQWWKIEILTSVVKGLKILRENSSVAGQPWFDDFNVIGCRKYAELPDYAKKPREMKIKALS